MVADTSVQLMLEVVALGGLGEFGMNMLALTWAETTLVVDAGVMFPDPELLGVDRIIPDLTYLQQKGGAAALVVTHGHEDHIGGVPHVLHHLTGPRSGAGTRRAQAARTWTRGQRVPRHHSPPGPRHGRSPLARIHPRPAQHPR